MLRLAIFIISAIGFNSILFSQSQVILTPADNGSSPWIVPCGVTSITVSVVGGGGAGGDGNQQSGQDNGGGGGGGGEVRLLTFAVTAGTAYPFSVGTGGINGGVVDGTSSIWNGTVVANGGFGGTNSSGTTPGVGGAGGSGGSGGFGYPGSLGEDGAYSNATGYGGFGGNNGAGSGGAIQNTIGDSDGTAGTAGGGGAGGFGNSSDGGNGGNGRIVITLNGSSYGANPFLDPCVTQATMSAVPVSLPLVGTWQNLNPSVPEVIDNPTDPATTISNLVPGTNYTLDWVISGVGCPSWTQTAIITTNLPQPDAGNDIQLCAGSLALNGSIPGVGLTGAWSCIGCGGAGVTPTTSSDPNQVISGMNAGETVTFIWTVSDGGLCSASDQVTVNYPLVCNDGPCGAIPIPNNGCLNGQVLSSATATPSTGMDEPGCGGYSPTDVDLWYSFTVPADGFMNFNVNDMLPTTTTANMEVAFYSGPCDDLELEFCNPYYPGSVGFANSGMGIFEPGETIYIRVWTYNPVATVTFNFCEQVYTPTVPIEIFPGMNDISCGEVFMDPNTGFNYGNNQHVVYRICPPAGSFASINFSSWNLAFGDQLTILDGAATNAPIIASFGTGGTLPGSGTNQTITASGQYGDSCLTVIWQSNYITGQVGWVATTNCSATPGNLPAVCGPSDCLGGCMPTICAIPGTATFVGVGTGASYELNESNNGCFQAGYEGEQCTNWFLVNPVTPGTLTCDIYVNPGQDHDFAVYEAYAPALDCPSLTSNQPIRCNAAGGGNAMGTGWNSGTSPYNYTTDPYYEPEIVITQAQIDAGIYFIINLKNYNNGCSNPEVDITFGGTATVSCAPPSILPIELVSFTGNSDDRYNMLYWETAAEINNDYFTLLGSPDGSNWQELGKIDGAGTSFQHSYYEFEDDILSLQMTYYKLKQTDFDGEFKYSQVIALARDFEFTTIFSQFFPNPSTNTFYFNYGGDYFNQPIEMNIYNNMGQIVMTQTYENFNSQMSMSVDCSGLAKGMYQVELSQGDKTEYQKIMLSY